MTDDAVAEAQTILTHENGLHARPAVRFTQLAASFDAEVQLRVGDRSTWINAKSIVKVTKLKARTSETLFIRAEGSDADRAVRALVDLVDRRFDVPAA